MTTKTQFKWFWAWDDAKEELWLHEMSLQGWHFKSVSLPGNYIFEQGEPTDYVYRLDYFTNTKDSDSYLQLFEDAGWDHMGKMNSWQYFRQEAVEGQELEIFTDNASKAKKYQRLMLFHVILFPIFFNLILVFNRNSESDLNQIISIGVSIFLILYIYALARLLGRITQLLKS
ncbi:MAG: DUF2812 domain-containing protein [Anaerolineaceae bacterium]|nr:DUF2812 domain-containing protein [Anaerolineaceae bacterium]